MAKKRKKTTIIVIAHHKGGVGKSTIAINLAHALLNINYKTALVDFDTQGTSKKLSRNLDIYTKNDDIEESKYSVIIIDTPPYLSKDLPILFGNADLVIMPARPNPSDVDTLPDTIRLFNSAKIKNSDLKGAILINQNNSQSTLWDEIKPFFERLNFPILSTIIESRVSYARSIVDDKGIFSQDDKKSQQEISNLAIEIINLLKI